MAALIDSIRNARAGASSSKSETRNPKGESKRRGRSSRDAAKLEIEGGVATSSSKSEIRNPNEGRENEIDGDSCRELRNEPTGVRQVNSSQVETKTEVTPKQRTGVAPANGGVLRNEAKPATGAGAHRGTWQPKAWDHSRRARRAREAMRRSAGRRETECQAES